MQFDGNKKILLFILFIAALLRFYNFFDIPFTHDEFSALFRLNFDSFGELIEKGVKVDGHPAGVQVFLYYWTKIFGTDEWIVKLPFTIAGIFSVYLIYLIGREWYNETVGLISAAYLASIQYTVMYSQIARPYASGLFFTLAMVYFWTQLIKKPDKRFSINLSLYTLFAVLSVYNHYFSFLFAIIVGITGLFLINKQLLKKYLIAAGVVFLFFVPYIPVFLHQLKIGGVGTWLAKPKPEIFLDYIEYIFQYSKLALLATSVVFFVTLVKAGREYPFKTTLMFFLWFLLPMVIGYFYSVYRNPVLQFSVLIFSFPYLYFVIFGHSGNLKPLTNLVLVLLIMSVNIYALIFERQHYKLFYNSIYEKILSDFTGARNEHKKALALVFSNRNITDYYLKKKNININFVWLNQLDKEYDLRKTLKDNFNKCDYVYLGATSFIKPDYVPIITEYYPYIVFMHNYAGGTTYLFAKNGKNKIDSLVCLTDFESNKNSTYWHASKSKITTCGNTKCYTVGKEQEWGPGCEIPLDSITSSKNDFVDVSVDVSLPDSCNYMPDVTLVTELRSGGKTVYWNGYNLKNFIDTVPFKRISLINSVKLSDIYLNYDSLILKTYIWNKSKRVLLIDNFTIKARKGNPFVYGLVEKLP